MDNFHGCLKSPVDLRDYKVVASSDKALPDEYELELLPRVKHQKSVSSCVAHTASSILEYYELACGRENHLSTNFIYGIQKYECEYEGRGMYTRNACKIVAKYGDMLESECPGNNEVPECWEIAEEALANESFKDNASSFKIKSYFSCNTPEAIKEAIVSYGPVLGVIKWYSSYQPDKKGVLSTTKLGNKGYHAVMIYGWDKTGFKCQNSWGKSWGNSGRCVIPYEIKIEEARCFVDAINTKVIIPKRNSVLDMLHKIANFILNLFRNK